MRLIEDRIHKELLNIGRPYRRKKVRKSRTQGDTGEIIRVRLPSEGEVLGQVIQNLGGRLLLVRCLDDKTRKVAIPGRYRRRMWTRVGDVIILIPQYGLNPDEKGTLEFRYSKNETKLLYQRRLIPEEYIV